MIPIDFQVTMLTSNCWSSFKCRPVIFFEQLAGYLPKTVQWLPPEMKFSGLANKVKVNLANLVYNNFRSLDNPLFILKSQNIVLLKLLTAAVA